MEYVPAIGVGMIIKSYYITSLPFLVECRPLEDGIESSCETFA
jgi:hypothetical protein